MIATAWDLVQEWGYAALGLNAAGLLALAGVRIWRTK